MSTQTSTQTSARATLADQGFDFLLSQLDKAQDVYSIVRHVSASGMTRNISFFVVSDSGQLLCLDRMILAAGLGNTPRGGKDGVAVQGAGMDMCFHVVYSLGYKLNDDGYRWNSRTL